MKALELIKKIWNRLDWRFSVIQMIEIILLFSIYPLMLWANPQWFVEDGIVENVQVIMLALIAMNCFMSSKNHQMFVFCGLVVMFLIMRQRKIRDRAASSGVG